MALSEEEQRLLEQMEAALAAEDPKLASALRGRSHRSQRRRVLYAGLGLLVGLAVLVGGMQLHPAVSVVGFVVMLAASVMGVLAWQQAELSGDSSSGGGRPGGPSEKTGRSEERWFRGQDDSA